MDLNIPTILIGLAVLTAVVAVALKLIHDRRHGKSCCGSACAGCPHAGQCPKK
ncbi:MAG: FeoB-associated Cys-rich membrane protein [Christensenellales bacterium]|jgi:hypothetical protein